MAATDKKLAWKMMAGLAIGALAGGAAQAWIAFHPDSSAWIPGAVTQVIEPLGRVFLHLIFMVVLPLMISAITIGVVQMGDVARLGRTGARCLLWTVVLATAAVLIGITITNLFQPGKAIPEEARERLMAQYQSDATRIDDNAKKSLPIGQALLNLIPRNPAEEAVNAFNSAHTGGGMLALMVFSLILGVAIVRTDPQKTAPLISLLESVFEVSMTIIGFAMRIAPFCVACLVFGATVKLGWNVLAVVLGFTLTTILGLLIHATVVYGAVLHFGAKISPFAFYSAVREALLTAFGTASGNATLPVSLRVAEQNLKIQPRIARFVLTVGASANQNGTALFEGVVVLFLAQVAGVDLSLQQQILVCLMCILAGIGTAGVPGGSLPVIAGIMASVGINPALLALIIGVDRLLDMCRTVVNVAGDMVIACAVNSAHDDPQDTPVPTPAAA